MAAPLVALLLAGACLPRTEPVPSPTVRLPGTSSPGAAMPAAASPMATRPAVPSPAPSPSPRPAGPSPTPAAASPSPSPAAAPIARGRFVPVAEIPAIADRIGGAGAGRIVPAIVAVARGRGVQSDRIADLIALAPEAPAVDIWIPGPAAPRFASLAPTEVYLNRSAAAAIGAAAGQSMDLYLGARPTQVRIKQLLPDEVLARPEPTVYLTLATAQVLLGRPDQANAFLVDAVDAGGRPVSPAPVVPVPPEGQIAGTPMAPR